MAEWDKGKRSRSQAATIVVAALFVGVGFYFAGERRDVGVLDADASTLKIGEVWLDDAYTCDVPIRNLSTKDVVVTRFKTSCSCTKVTPASLVIPAGRAATIQVTLDLSPVTSDEASQEVREFNVMIAPVLEEHLPGQISWTMTGRVRSPFAIPDRRALQDVVKGRGQSQVIKVFSFSGLDQVAARAELAKVSVSVLETGGEFSLTLAPDDSLPLGSFKSRVLVSVTTKDGDTCPDIPISFLFDIVNDVVCTPSSVVAGPQRIGRTYSEKLVLSSRADDPFVVQRVDTPVTSKVVLAPTIGQRQSTAAQTYDLTQQIELPGSVQQYVRFHIQRTADGVIEEVIVPILYHGRPELNLGDKENGHEAESWHL